MTFPLSDLLEDLGDALERLAREGGSLQAGAVRDLGVCLRHYSLSARTLEEIRDHASSLDLGWMTAQSELLSAAGGDPKIVVLSQVRRRAPAHEGQRS